MSMKIKTEHIFDETQEFEASHASTLVELDDGNFLVAWFAGTREGDDDVGIWGASSSGIAWSKPQLLVKMRDEPHWNPVLFRDCSGVIHLFFKVGKKIETWESWVIRSKDQGQSWSEPVEVVAGDRGGRGPVKNKLIVLSDGTWLAPASIEKERWDAFVDRSEDKGKTWNRNGWVPMDKSMFTAKGKNGVIQPTLWESSPGNVHMLLRSTCGAICRSDSTDNGLTWSKIYKTALPNNNSGIDVAQLDQGVLALVYNPVSENWGPRTPLMLAFSFDNGITWPRQFILEDEPVTDNCRPEFSYPAVIKTNTGFALTYTWKRKSIAFYNGKLSDFT